MDSNKKIDSEALELYENARQRLKQKKRLVTHLVVFVAGSVIFIFVNIALGYMADFKPFNNYWFVTAILIWLFFLIIHAINIFIVNTLMSKEWEEKQMNKLVEKQLERLRGLQKKVDKKHPIDEPTQDNENS
jgi:NhaP-type Na+/H+ or K+/H+ antiporter